ncbi:venom dipeptidyl peptidase 4 isoform X1 [Hyalella azteca]|uniref:Venom dipeptidyl peptidase 4 n=2 Tax=Hyalella azteca TaxID=294128 RepID=A0A979FKA2_HYAAZ|nr:venom dipeptidyl peptidase 4 isoform X1 [Hyalella azteca]
MIITSVMLLTPPDTGPRIKGNRTTLKQFLDGDFNVRSFNGTWISNNEVAILDPAGGLTALHAQNLTITRSLVSNITFRQLNVEDYSVSSDQEWVLLAEHHRGTTKHYDLSKYHLYEVSSQHYSTLTPTPGVRRHPGLRLVEWSPVGAALVMVDENFNIIYKPHVGEAEQVHITDDGEAGAIINGVADWLYEEEVLHSRKALWFSPSGERLLYAQFNDTLVREVPITQYGVGAKYPSLTMVRYPKPGDAIPRVTLWMVDLASGKYERLSDIKPPEVIRDQDYYVTAVTWVAKNSVSVVWMNRPQNTSIISICSEPQYYCEPIHTEHSHHGWTEIYEAPIFSENGMSFLVRLPVRDGEHGNFAHINLYDVNMRRVTPMTHGPFDVTEILGWDEQNGYIYYIATVEEDPGARHVYRIPFVLAPLLRQADCISCSAFENLTSHCLYNNGILSPDFSYIILECLGPGLPKIYLYSTNTSYQEIMELDNYSHLQDLLNKTAMPQVKVFKVKLDERDSAMARVQLYLPPGLREDELTKYPVVVEINAAPGSQSVDWRLKPDVGLYLASHADMIYVRIDGRGTGNNGDKYKHEVYHNLGVKEVEDQLAVLEYMKKQLPFIDASRIALWGWQYGAFITLMAMARDKDDVIKCGLAVAPITRFEHYDAVFSERYMGSPHILPGSNYKGYEAADVTKVAGNLKNKFLMLVHGTADHSVHYHHTMLLAKALADEGILFRQMTYSDEGHRLLGVKEHFYKTLEMFISDCFRPSVEEIYYHIKKKKELEEIAYVSTTLEVYELETPDLCSSNCTGLASLDHYQVN